MIFDRDKVWYGLLYDYYLTYSLHYDTHDVPLLHLNVKVQSD